MENIGIAKKELRAIKERRNSLNEGINQQTKNRKSQAYYKTTQDYTYADTPYVYSKTSIDNPVTSSDEGLFIPDDTSYLTRKQIRKLKSTQQLNSEIFSTFILILISVAVLMFVIGTSLLKRFEEVSNKVDVLYSQAVIQEVTSSGTTSFKADVISLKDNNVLLNVNSKYYNIPLNETLSEDISNMETQFVGKTCIVVVKNNKLNYLTTID